MSEFLPYVKALEAITDRVRVDITALKKGDMMVWTKQSLTKARMVAHLKGEAARGVCPIKAGQSTVRCALLDLDSHKGETSQSDMVKAACDVSDRLFIDGIYTMAFRSSGGRGIHLIMLWNDDLDAYSVRQYLAEVLADCGFKNGTGGVAAGQIEIFPKQDYVAEDGNGSQFILPLFNKSEPIDLQLGLELGRDAILDEDFWKISYPIAKREKPVRAPAKAPSGELNQWVPYLYAIDPEELNYEEWLEKVGFALHYETEGSDEGFDLWDAWSSQSSKYTTTEYGRYKWDSIKNDKVSNVTGQTLVNMARERGYNLDIADDFEVEGNYDVDVGSEVLGSDGRYNGGSAGAESVSVVGTGSTNKGLSAAIGAARKPLPKFTYTKNGEIEATLNNIKKAVERPDLCGWAIKFDLFRDEIIRFDENGKWHQFIDDDYTALRLKLTAQGFKEIGPEAIRAIVSRVARDNQFDSAIAWLNDLPAWDGVPRIDTFLIDYMRAENSAYVRAVGAYMWTALAGRVLDPGCQVEMAPILMGEQGLRKTSAVKAIVPHKELYCGVSFNEKDDDLARKMRGRLIAEIGELKGFHTREIQTIKEFISRSDENWVPKFKEFQTSFPRRLVFIGTTNETEFLVDDTGNRRWLPLEVGHIDIDAIKRDRNQLWAEGRERFKASGVAYKEAEELAKAVHGKYMVHDAWQDIIEAWLHCADLDGKAPIDNDYLLISDILRDALAFDMKHIKRADEVRVGKILRVLGFERAVRRVNGKLGKVWISGVTLLV